MIWEIRKDKKVVVASNIEKCGYDKKTLASMKKAGYVLYKNGKVYKEEKSNK